MSLPVNGSTHLISAYYSIYRPRKDERLSQPSWLTYSGRFTHISGHPSVAGRAQDRGSSPARARRSTNCATPPTYRRSAFASSLCSILLIKGHKRKAVQWSVRTVSVGADVPFSGSQPALDVTHVDNCAAGGGWQDSLLSARPAVTLPPSHRASPTFGRFQFILLGEQRQIRKCV